MFYYTQKDSESGKRIEVLYKKKIKGLEVGLEFYNQHGFFIWIDPNNRLIACFHPTALGQERFKNWRNISNAYLPDNRTKEGKRMSQQLANIPQYTPEEISECGIKKGNLLELDFNEENNLFGIMLNEEQPIPQDCTRIFKEQFESLFPDIDTTELPF